MSDFGGEELAAGGTGQDVRGAQIHEAVLAEGVSTLQDAGDLFLVVVSVKADGTCYIHFE